jgi:hypothetical protein
VTKPLSFGRSTHRLASVKVPEGCHPAAGNDLDQIGRPLFPGLDEAGRPAYVCFWKGTQYTYPVGLKGLFTFELEIDKVVPNAKGLIQIKSTSRDADAANNCAELALNPPTTPRPPRTDNGQGRGARFAEEGRVPRHSVGSGNDPVTR